MQTDSREQILARIREALRAPAPARHLHGDSSATQSASSAEAWLPPVPDALEDRIRLFEKNSEGLRTEFIRCAGPAEIQVQLGALAADAGWKRIASHRFALGEAAVESLGLPVLWTDEGYEVDDLESADAAITGCDCLVAQTGSILVTARSAGGRALSVLPPRHVVLATRAQVVGNLADAYEQVRATHGGAPPAFLSFITGPSRTGDIERILVLGAHGPKRLTILFADSL